MINDPTGHLMYAFLQRLIFLNGQFNSCLLSLFFNVLHVYVLLLIWVLNFSFHLIVLLWTGCFSLIDVAFHITFCISEKMYDVLFCAFWQDLKYLHGVVQCTLFILDAFFWSPFKSKLSLLGFIIDQIIVRLHRLSWPPHCEIGCQAFTNSNKDSNDGYGTPQCLHLWFSLSLVVVCFLSFLQFSRSPLFVHSEISQFLFDAL